MVVMVVVDVCVTSEVGGGRDLYLGRGRARGRLTRDGVGGGRGVDGRIRPADSTISVKQR